MKRIFFHLNHASLPIFPKNQMIKNHASSFFKNKKSKSFSQLEKY